MHQENKARFLYKYVYLVLLFCLIFSIGSTLARYSTSSTGDISTDIQSFDVQTHLYTYTDDTYVEISGLGSIELNQIEDYEKTYYISIYNNDNEILYYSIQLCEEFIFIDNNNESASINGYIDSYSNIEYMPLTIKANLDEFETTPKEKDVIDIDMWVEYQHTESY